MKICNIDKPVNNRAWCHDCKMVHAGHTIELSQDESEKGQKWREQRRNKKPATSKLLRSPEESKQCVYLESHHLTNDEAKGLEEIAGKLGTNCRGCSGNTLLQKCSNPEAGVGGYTTVAYCSNNCRKFRHRDIIRLGTSKLSKYGVVIGSYGMPGVVELSIAMIRKTCGEVPILIADDFTPVTMGRKRLLELPEKWPGVSLVITGENLGHAPGDIRAFRNGIKWAKENGIKYLCKLSQRFIFLQDNWLKIVSDEMEATGHAVSSQRAVHLNLQFRMRTECVFMDVDRCSASVPFMERLDPKNGKINAAAEDWFAAAVDEGGLGPVMRCRLMPVDRFEKKNTILWHNTDGVDAFGAADMGDAYRKLAKEMNIDLGEEFSAAGWHIIAPNRPDAKYHML
jgi:hypothetical protein